ncbi:hypothetical protein BXO88_06540 [Oribacterium sp. C9]|uniref:IS1096 element passenger TnpR family protein n=1 Tax=Oribacterium sp. C9 TaxID=1943579 RepID=UPI0009C6BD90|nr:hypothetical protein [Oribacterium sp. C9]OON86649.1 hypothetical protein BXO88_06540 [Oribacterium sp. C9]
MKYHFKAGQKDIILDEETATFEELGYEILKAFNIYPSNMFEFEFEDGEFTSSTDFPGTSDDDGQVAIASKIKDKGLKPGDQFMFMYDYSNEWTRTVKFIKFE